MSAALATMPGEYWTVDYGGDSYPLTENGPPSPGLSSSLRSSMSAISEDVFLPCFSEAVLRLDGFRQFGQGWDTYDADPIDESAIAGAHKLLGALQGHIPFDKQEQSKPCAVVPLADGGVQLEWRSRIAELEVEIHGETDFGYLLVRKFKADERAEEGDNVQLSRIVDLICEVARV